MQLANKPCGLCGALFKPYNTHQQYCCRKCFRHAYAQKKKDKNKHFEFPKYICHYCRVIILLTFDPRKDLKKLQDLICPHCGRPREECLHD